MNMEGRTRSGDRLNGFDQRERAGRHAGAGMDDDGEPADTDRPRLARQLDDTSTGHRAHHRPPLGSGDGTTR